ncbi:hypothetical protein [Roseibium aggregatum]|uniref:Uncharacterized protein n=1 Tax=Roseibium aggregatum TaxID=187304 RepID=A0A0M6YC59_9HYPH|nr:hypothetical protein [Roseibium aggregatum]CTQ47268.1 hypothetical protein LAL4801_05730 [Roseibium aggregatum]
MSDIQNEQLSLPPVAEIEIDGNDLDWARAAFENAASGPEPLTTSIAFKQVEKYKVEVTGVHSEPGQEQKSKLLDGQLFDADGVSKIGYKLLVSADNFFRVADELCIDVRDSEADYGVIEVSAPNELGQVEMEYQGVSIANEQHFTCLHGHVAETVKHFIGNGTGVSYSELKLGAAEVTKDRMQFDVQLVSPDQSFTVEIEKTRDKWNKPEYGFRLKTGTPSGPTNFVTAVSTTERAVRRVLTRYCNQANHDEIDQDFTKLPGAEMKKSGPTFSKSSKAPEELSLSPSM